MAETVVWLRKPDQPAALESLNRITGLRFSSWPQSLARNVMDQEHVAPAVRQVAPVLQLLA